MPVHFLLNLNTRRGIDRQGDNFKFMGLFDIFKNTEGEQGSGLSKETNDNAAADAKRYEFSLQKTESISGLLNIAPEARDQQWLSQLLTDLPHASFRSGNPQIIAGPDGFPYFQLFLPQPGETFQNFIIDLMVPDFLLERGYGIVINPDGGHPDWILSYGDLLNYKLNGSFLTQDNSFNQENDEELTAGEEVLIGQPSENILPVATRKLLKDFFELNGVEDPKVLLMMRKKGEDMQQDLAFNITPDKFDSETTFRNMMQTVTWYLPRHYSVIGLHDDALNSGFMPL